MKRVNILLSLVVLLAIALTSCKRHEAKSVTLKTDIDSLNYAFGFSNGKILKEYHLNNDTTGEGFKSLMEGIMKGLEEEVSEVEGIGMVKEMGTNIGTQLRTVENFYGDSTILVDMAFLRQGFINGISGFEGSMSPQQAQEYFNATMQLIQNRNAEREFAANKEAGLAFLAQNATAEGVQTTASGLQYKVITAGKANAPKPTAESKVKVHYHGTLLDGTVFDSSVDRGTPAEFFLNQVIKGWTEGLQLMPVGSKYIFYVPQELAYGAQNTGVIQPFSTLIFEVELLEIL